MFTNVRWDARRIPKMRDGMQSGFRKMSDGMPADVWYGTLAYCLTWDYRRCVNMLPDMLEDFPTCEL